jgi:hypothetical protein
VFFGQLGAMKLKKGSLKLCKFVSDTDKSFTDRGFRGVFQVLISLQPGRQGILKALSRTVFLETAALQLKAYLMPEGMAS